MDEKRTSINGAKNKKANEDVLNRKYDIDTVYIQRIEGEEDSVAMKIVLIHQNENSKSASKKIFKKTKYSDQTT